MEEMVGVILAGERAQGRGKDLNGYVYTGAAYEGLTCNFLEWVAGEGGGQLLELAGEHNDTLSITVNNAATVRALERMRRWYDSDMVSYDVLTYTETQAHQLFLSGHAIFMRNWLYVSSLIPTSPVSGRVNVTYLPGGSVNTGVSTFGGNDIGISKQSRNQGWANLFAQFLVSPQEQSILAVETGQQPVLKQSVLDAGGGSSCNSSSSLPACLLPNPRLVARPSALASPNYAVFSSEISTFVHRMMTSNVPIQLALNDLECTLAGIVNIHSIERCELLSKTAQSLSDRPWFIALSCVLGVLVLALAIFAVCVVLHRAKLYRERKRLKMDKFLALKESRAKSEFLASVCQSRSCIG
jgi:trehalose/maltose transport system substrate-binding protein